MWRYKNEAQPPGESGISTIALKNPRFCRARNLVSAAFKSPDVQWLKAIDSTVGFYSHIGGMVIRIFNIPLMSKLFGLWDDKLKHRYRAIGSSPPRPQRPHRPAHRPHRPVPPAPSLCGISGVQWSPVVTVVSRCHGLDVGYPWWIGKLQMSLYIQHWFRDVFLVN